MGLIDRHKKPGGYRKLVNSLEITSPDKRAKILETLRIEDSAFVEDVEKDILNFDELGAINEMMISELVSSMREMQTLAVALYKTPPDFIAKFTKSMTPAQQRRFHEETMTIDQLTVAQRMASQFKVVETARLLQEEGKITIKEYNTKYPG